MTDPLSSLWAELEQTVVERRQMIADAVELRDRRNRGLQSDVDDWFDMARLESAAKELQYRCDRLSRRVHALVNQISQKDTPTGAKGRRAAPEELEVMEELVQSWLDHPLIHSRRREHELTAYHEAAHAVVACLLGLRFIEVTIRQAGNSLGHIELVRQKVSVIDDIVMSWAGVLAEQRRCGAGDEDGPVTGSLDPEGMIDYAHIVELTEEVTGGQGLERDRWVWRLRRRAEDLLDRPEVWAAVESVARGLQQRRTLSEAECRRVVARIVTLGDG
jgi:hypothetical protein